MLGGVFELASRLSLQSATQRETGWRTTESVKTAGVCRKVPPVAGLPHEFLLPFTGTSVVRGASQAGADNHGAKRAANPGRSPQYSALCQVVREVPLGALLILYA